MQFYSQFISSGDLVFDIGANLGTKTDAFLRLDARVIAVEPQARCVDRLRSRLQKFTNLTIIQCALGAESGLAELMVPSAGEGDHALGSLSEGWINAVKQSGRFSCYEWDECQVVPVTTLDALIEQFGVPAFVKIDVEGFEYEVIKGLSQPLKMLSLEFTPEFIESTWACLDRLAESGLIKCNFAIGKSAELDRQQWMSVSKLKQTLLSMPEFRDDVFFFGDVYVRCLSREDSSDG